MLVLTRKIGEEILIGHNITVKVLTLKRGEVRFGISAPDDVRVDRSEVRDRILGGEPRLPARARGPAP
jgi:carbon storage regulator